MNIGLTSMTFRQLSPEQIIEIMKAAEVDGIEWGDHGTHVPVGDTQNAKRVGELTRAAGFRVFSYGSYYKLCEGNPRETFPAVLETAVALAAPIIRTWPGTRASADCDEAYYQAAADEARIIADMAREQGVTIGFEYHPNTLTDREQSAKRLMDMIDHPYCKLYWQPNYSLTFEENLSAIRNLRPYFAGNFHLHNYADGTGHQLLSCIEKEIREYYVDYTQSDFNLMVEFVKDSEPENFYDDVKTVRGCINV